MINWTAAFYLTYIYTVVAFAFTNFCVFLNMVHLGNPIFTYSDWPEGLIIFWAIVMGCWTFIYQLVLFLSGLYRK